MSTVVHPTYLLAPNWSYQPGGPIALGNIIADPLKPHRPLSKPTVAAPLPPTQLSVEKNWHLETEKTRAVNVNLWTQILNVATFNIGTHRTKAGTVAFEMTQLDTIYFSEDPSVESMAIRAADPRVKTALKVGRRLFRGEVYMISGIKVARDFKVTQSISTDVGAQLGIGGSIAPEASIGADLGIGSGKSRVQGSEAAQDLIFAYQLLKIRPRGAGEDLNFELSEFQGGAVFLDDGGREDEDELEVPDLEVIVPALRELSESQKGLAVNPDGDQQNWLFSK